jgi:hypothetical protein
MKFAAFLTLAASALVLAAPAPEPAQLHKRLLCQLCNVGGLEGGPACCSLHVSHLDLRAPLCCDG